MDKADEKADEEEGESTAPSLLARLALGEAETAAVVVVEVLDVVVVVAATRVEIDRKVQMRGRRRSKKAMKRIIS